MNLKEITSECYKRLNQKSLECLSAEDFRLELLIFNEV